MNEAKLQGLIESIQQRENGVNFERSIESLQVSSVCVSITELYVHLYMHVFAVPNRVRVRMNARLSHTGLGSGLQLQSVSGKMFIP